MRFFLFFILNLTLASCNNNDQKFRSLESENGKNIKIIQDSLNSVVPTLMQRFHVPGVAIALVDSNGPLLIANYGHLNESESKQINENTVFEAASLGKPLFGYTVITQLDNKVFNIDTPIVSILKEPFVKDPLGTKITTRHFLSHSSGLIFSKTDEQRHVTEQPGSKWKYSGLGFYVLQETLEKLKEMPLEIIMQQFVFNNLQMKNSSYLSLRKESQPMATGHDREGQQITKIEWPEANAASSLNTTTTDYGKFLSHTLAELQEVKLKTASKLMVEPQINVDSFASLYWGLGWAVATAKNDTLFFQWGSNPGFKSLALGSINQGKALIVLTNGDNGLEVATSIAPIIFGYKYPFLDFYMMHPDD
jgi:CubicO group peptidase (beta-lactamase class C family)